MSKRVVSKRIRINQMTCGACEAKIEKKIKSLDGVIKAKASCAEACLHVTFNEDKLSLSKIEQTIAALGYEVLEENPADKADAISKMFQLLAAAIIIFGAFVVINRLGLSDIFNKFPQATAGMGYAAIFIIGLLTSIHCVGMCGGICLSLCAKAKGENVVARLTPSFLYNLGRVVSYTLIGAAVGALGSVIAFNGVMRGAVAIFAGLFMVIMGISMLNIFPWVSKLNIKMPKFIADKLLAAEGKSPLYVGLLNGFMPCGPLQAMQLYALSTASPLKGAVAMFLFSLGTVPLIFGLGAASSFLSKKFASKIMAASGVLVITLGLVMFNTGLSMSGFLGAGTQKASAKAFEPIIQDGYQIVTIDLSPRGYAPIVVKKGIPVKFNIRAEARNINGCNNAIIIPKYNIEMPLKPGDNIAIFVPRQAGVFPYTCWMNMMRSSITVVE